MVAHPFERANRRLEGLDPRAAAARLDSAVLLGRPLPGGHGRPDADETALHLVDLLLDRGALGHELFCGRQRGEQSRVFAPGLSARVLLGTCHIAHSLPIIGGLQVDPDAAPAVVDRAIDFGADAHEWGE